MSEKRQRIEIMDALRGLSVVLMVIHHLLYNLVYFLGAPVWLFTNPVFDVLRYIFAGAFIILSGVSSRFSRGNIKRGAKALLIAGAITLVTYLLNMPIWFGVLHLLGFSMVFFGVTHKLWDLIPKTPALIFFLLCITAGALATTYIAVMPEQEYARVAVWLLGWRQPGLRSFDYFPLLPWLFVFLLGTWAGYYIASGRLPQWFYEARFPLFPKIGRYALLIYVLHQPILYSAVRVIALLIQ